MIPRASRALSAILSLLWLASPVLSSGPLIAETSPAPGGLAVDEHPGEYVPLDLQLTGEDGQPVRLGDLFENQSQKPVIIIPSYYTCPKLCTYIFRGVQKAAAEVQDSRGLRPGRDYTILSVSFRPEDTPAMARRKGASFRAMFDPDLPEGAWQFLTGPADQVAALMDSLGYRYRPDGEKDFSHSATIVMLAPDGKITRYLYGVLFPPASFRLSLIESSYGKIGTTAEKVFLYCFRYDSQTGKYTPYVWGFVRIGGLLTLVCIAGTIFLLLRKEKG